MLRTSIEERKHRSSANSNNKKIEVFATFMIRLVLLLAMLVALSSTLSFHPPLDYNNSPIISPLRLSVSHQIPFNFVTRLPNGSYAWEGCMFQVWKWISEKINRPIIAVVPTTEELKQFGYNQASLNHVLNGEADVDVMAISILAEQLEYIEISYPISMNPFRMIVPAPKEKNRLFAFIRPFQPLVWLFLLVSLIASVLTKSAISWFHQRFEPKRNDNHSKTSDKRKSFKSYLAKYIMYSTAIITAHGTRNVFNHQQNGLRIFGGLWLLVMTVMVYGYSSLLIASLTIPEFTKPIETLEDVANSNQVTFYVNPDGLAGLGRAVMEGKSGVWKALGDQLRKRPEGQYSKALTEADFSVERQNFATPQLDYYTKWMISRIYKKEKKCRFHLTAPIPFNVRLHFPMTKGAEVNSLISKAILDMWEFGLQDHWVNEAFFIPGADACFAKKKVSTKLVPIKLVDLTSPFLILGIGLGLSLFCFLIELIVAKYHHEMNQEKKGVGAVENVNRRAAAFDKQTKPLKNGGHQGDNQIIEKESQVVELN